MSLNSPKVCRGGFWNCAKTTYSEKTQQLLKEMIRESKLTSYQQRKLQQTVQNGDSLPLRCVPNSHEFEKKKDLDSEPKKAPKVLNANLLKGGKRTLYTIAAMGAYDEPTYQPHPYSRCYDQEKQKLANIMAFGKDQEPMPLRLTRLEPEEPEEEIDRFDELQKEIKEREDFLQEMESLGQGKKYRSMIQTEISMKIREMEIIDKKRTLELENWKKEKLKQEKQKKSRIFPTENENEISNENSNENSEKN